MPEQDKQFYFDEIGVEDESDIESTEASRAFITGSDWTTETIVSQLRKGNIDLNPSFQRREVWTAKRKSSLIESIILNFPIPQLVLAAQKDDPNTYIVLDGKQRLLAIRQFCADPNDDRDEQFQPLYLEGLTVREELNGESREGLVSQPDQFQNTLNAFDNHTIRTVVIRHWPDEDYLHRVFQRLNTGSVPLSSQELRQAIHPGPFTDFVDDFSADSNSLQQALGIEKPDFRMRDNEILLRAISFGRRAEEYRGNLKRFLDESTELFNTQWAEYEDTIYEEAKRCEAAIDATIEIFGAHNSFSTYSGAEFEGRFNRAVFDIMLYYFRDQTIRDKALEVPEQITDYFVQLSVENSEFQQSLIATTKSMGATATRLSEWARALESAIGMSITPPVIGPQKK
ncbi:MAG: DUF262 domain-containing protein [bacterium]|nr:DUF262 domain-containing protein [bacterium]